MAEPVIPVEYLAHLASIELTGRGPGGHDPRSAKALARMGRDAHFSREQVETTLLAGGGDPVEVAAAVENAFTMSDIVIAAKVHAAMHTLSTQRDKLNAMSGQNPDTNGNDDADRYAAMVIRIVGED